MGHHHHHHDHRQDQLRQPPLAEASGDELSPVDGAARQQLAERATWVSVAVNLLMTLVQLVIGWLGNSQSLVAHGLHSLSDLLSDFLVIYATRQSAHPADDAHPYGHARMETAATLVLGTSLALIGLGILWESGTALQTAATLPVVGLAAFWTAVATVVAKELLYRYLIRVAEKLRSQLLTANALHTRADAASALIVVIGIGGALLGWSFLDLLAAALMGFMILRMGVELAWGALKELIDTGLDEAQVSAIRQTLEATPGVCGLHELRTRRMAHQALVDAHVQVDPRISASEGHAIAESARRRVLRQHPEVLDVLVHIDPEADDLAPPRRLPAREALLAEIEPFLADLPPPERIVLHYLGGAIEAEVYLRHDFFVDGAALQTAEQALAAKFAEHPLVRSISLNCLVAPK